MNKESLGLDLLDPEKNPFDIDEWHSFTTGLFLGLAIGFLGGWLAILLKHLDEESHYFALGFFFGMIIGLLFGVATAKLIYPILGV